MAKVAGNAFPAFPGNPPVPSPCTRRREGDGPALRPRLISVLGNKALCSFRWPLDTPFPASVGTAFPSGIAWLLTSPRPPAASGRSGRFFATTLGARSPTAPSPLRRRSRMAPPSRPPSLRTGSASRSARRRRRCMRI
eukprot:scaffold33419_cov101-Isochrysis_galbana.AAC.1